MDRLQTIGQEYHKGFCVKIYYTTAVNTIETVNKNLFQILYIDEGSVIVGNDADEKALIAPVLLCLNYFEKQKEIHLKNAKGFSIFFEAEAINHGLVASSSKNDVEDYLAAEQLLVYPFKKSNKDNPVYMPVNGSVRARLFRIASDMKEQFHSQPDEFWPCRGRSFFIEILMLLQSLYKLQIDNAIDLSTANKKIVPIVKEIHLNYSDSDFSAKDLNTKELLGTGFASLKRKSDFKKATGFAPATYLENLRMEVGANLLKDTILKISEIARRCGYKAEDDFVAVFLKHKEMSPATWRASFPNPYG